MRLSIRAGLLASALALSPVALAVSTAPAEARVNFSIGFNSFHNQLSNYGDWVYSDRWGEVWIPFDVPANFRPYSTRGHWAYTRSYGWIWVSRYPWGDITFHYGRWVNDPYDGWLWIPGYVWSPGWVVWRSNDRYTGWMPMPPDDDFMRGGFSIGFGGSGLWLSFNNYDDYYGYSRWYGRDYGRDRFASNWMFVDTGHLGASDYGRYSVSNTTQINTIIQTSNNTTNYTVVNNYVVNRSVDNKAVERASGRPVPVVQPATIFKNPDLITRADTGRQIQTQMRQAAPRGTGIANSAPKPSADVVNTLSTRSITRNGRQPTNLFTRQTIDKAPLAGPANAAPQTAPAPAETPAERALRMRQERMAPNTMAPATPATPNTTAPANTGETPQERRARMLQERQNAAPSTMAPATPATPNAVEPRERVRTVPQQPATAPAPTVAPTPPTPPAAGETPQERRARMLQERQNAAPAAPAATPATPDTTPADNTKPERKKRKPGEPAPTDTTPQ